MAVRKVSMALSFEVTDSRSSLYKMDLLFC